MSCWPASTSLLMTRVIQSAFRSPLLTSSLSRPLTVRPPHLPKLSARLASQRGSKNPRNTKKPRPPPRPPPRYNRSHRAPRSKYRIGAVVLCVGGFCYRNTDRVPISNRLRFNCIPYAYEEQKGQEALQYFMQEYQGRLLPPEHPDSKLVTKVLQRLIPASGLPDVNWEIFVVDDPEEENAFVLPGGKVFVFSGMLPICGGEDGVAAVLGHEIAHQFAHHNGEQMSGEFGFAALTGLIAGYFDISLGLSNSIVDIVLSKPHSRTQESEADFIGLLIMAQACYNPEAAVELWERMAKEEQNATHQFLSTHPTSKNRINQIQSWLPEAQAKRSLSDCGNTAVFADQFKQEVLSQHGDDDFW